MFTGLVEALGTVITGTAATPPSATSPTTPSPTAPAPDPPATPAAGRPGTLLVTVPFPVLAGESVAVNGVCLTATQASTNYFRADVMDRTATTSTLGRLAPGDQVNLERAALPTTRLGGHLVQGHVDGVAVLLGRRRAEDPGTALELTFGVDPELARYVARRGSITLDGVSLTVADSARDTFTVGIIPTTAEATTLGRLAPGHEVNVEIDVLARYLERLVHADPGAAWALASRRGW